MVIFFKKIRSTTRNNTCFDQGSDHSKITKGRTVHTKCTELNIRM